VHVAHIFTERFILKKSIELLLCLPLIIFCSTSNANNEQSTTSTPESRAQAIIDGARAGLARARHLEAKAFNCLAILKQGESLFTLRGLLEKKREAEGTERNPITFLSVYRDGGDEFVLLENNSIRYKKDIQDKGIILDSNNSNGFSVLLRDLISDQGTHQPLFGIMSGARILAEGKVYRAYSMYADGSILAYAEAESKQIKISYADAVKGIVALSYLEIEPGVVVHLDIGIDTAAAKIISYDGLNALVGYYGFYNESYFRKYIPISNISPATPVDMKYAARFRK
jgi:hypothetical protein